MLLPFLLLLLFLLCCFIGIPVGFCIGFTTWIAFLLLDGKMIVLAQKLFSGVNSFSYLCIPLFVLCAEIMTRGKLINKIVEFCNVLIGHVKGGLGYVNVLGSMVFAGISGSASADMASLGLIMADTMTAAGYDRRFSVTLSAASATIAPLIPPSTIMLIFASAAGGVSIGKMFAGGLLPGVVYGLAQIAICSYYARKYDFPSTGRRASLKEIWSVFRISAQVLALPVIIFGSIVTGICTATEAGSLAVCYALAVTFVQKRMNLKGLFRCLVNTARLTASVTFIVATACAMGWVVSAPQIPQKLAIFCLEFITAPILFLLFVNILLLIVGCLLDGAPAVLLLAPILCPVAAAYGIDPVHFGIVMCMNLTIGLITPPIGILLFVASNVTGTRLSELYKSVWPFVVTAVAVLLVITYIPVTVTFIPGLMK